MSGEVGRDDSEDSLRRRSVSFSRRSLAYLVLAFRWRPERRTGPEGMSGGKIEVGEEMARITPRRSNRSSD